MLSHPEVHSGAQKQNSQSGTLRQLGYHQQKKIYDWICQVTDDSPPVIDVQEIVNNPKDSLRTLCERLNIKFWTTNREPILINGDMPVSFFRILLFFLF